jgi:hypothetical protein
MYLNLVTAPMLQVDLFGYALMNKLTLIIMITGLVIFLIENWPFNNNYRVLG